MWWVEPTETWLPPQVLAGSGAPGLRAPCPVAAVTGTAPETVACTAVWTSLPAGCSPVQVRAVATCSTAPPPSVIILSNPGPCQPLPLTPGIPVPELPCGPRTPPGHS